VNLRLYLASEPQTAHARAVVSGEVSGGSALARERQDAEGGDDSVGPFLTWQLR